MCCVNLDVSSNGWLGTWTTTKSVQDSQAKLKCSQISFVAPDLLPQFASQNAIFFTRLYLFTQPHCTVISSSNIYQWKNSLKSILVGFCMRGKFNYFIIRKNGRSVAVAFFWSCICLCHRFWLCLCHCLISSEPYCCHLCWSGQGWRSTWLPTGFPRKLHSRPRK